MHRTEQDLQPGCLQASNIIIKNEELRNKFKTLLNNLHIGGANAFVNDVVIAATPV